MIYIPCARKAIKKLKMEQKIFIPSLGVHELGN